MERERDHNHAILYIESKYSIPFFSQFFYDFRHLMIVIKKRVHLSNQEAYKNRMEHVLPLKNDMILRSTHMLEKSQILIHVSSSLLIIDR